MRNVKIGPSAKSMRRFGALQRLSLRRSGLATSGPLPTTMNVRYTRGSPSYLSLRDALGDNSRTFVPPFKTGSDAKGFRLDDVHNFETKYAQHSTHGANV